MVLLKDIFNKYSSIKVDKNFLLKFSRYVHNYTIKNQTHIKFFGSNLLGVYPIRWYRSDREEYLESMLQITDISSLTREVHSLPDVDSSRYVSSDIFNLSIVWLAYKGLNSKDLSASNRLELAKAAYSLLYYKIISGINAHYFEYPANLNIAITLYESLDNKSLLKQHKNWKGVVTYRVSRILDNDYLHSKLIRSMHSDYHSVLLVNAINGSVKSLFNVLTSKFHSIKNNNLSTISFNKQLVLDGEKMIKDISSTEHNTKRYMNDVVTDRNGFISNDIIDLLANNMNTLNKNNLVKSLDYISAKYDKDKDIKNIFNLILTVLFDSIRNGDLTLHDTATTIFKIRAVMRSSGSKNKSVLDLRNKLDVALTKCLKTHSRNIIPITRNAVVLYITLKALIHQKK